ncbi:MAG: rhodanese-like domain-containing protein [Prevotella sp.]|nr:rhodanese-like domain-containing protein [Prevotella sp.]
MRRLIFMSIFTWLCALCGCKGQGSAAFRSVNAEEFAEIIADTTVVRLDVRTAEEYAAGHIDGAILIDVLQDDFLSEAEKQLPKDRTIALYCRSGRRSKTAAKLLAGEGFDVVELATGWLGWTDYNDKK